MWHYLKPWKRKLGIVTLLLACLFVVGWMRSLAISDCVFSEGTAQVISYKGGIWFEAAVKRPSFTLSYAKIDNSGKMYDDEGIWIWKGYGFAFGTDSNNTDRAVRFFIHYWLIVTPLTALSACLLLLKLRLFRSPQSRQ